MSGPIPAIFGIPFDFLLFGAILAGIAAFHRRALFITLGGLAAILLYQATLGGFPTGYGLHAFGEHLAHEWVILSNLFLLLLGFESSLTSSRRAISRTISPTICPITGAAARCC